MATEVAPEPLGPEDRAILRLEGPTVAGHTCKVIVLGPGAPSLEHLRGLVGERIGAVPELARRLGGTEAAPAWVADPGFDPAAHVVAPADPMPLDEPALRDAVAALFAQRLDRSRPLWRIDRLALDGGGAALVWRLHHALADGTAAMRFAEALLWDPVAAAAAGGGSRAGAATHRAGDARRRAHRADDARRRTHLAGFLRREYAPARGRSPFDGQIGTRRQVAFAVTSLAELRDAAHAAGGGTLNDAVLTVVAGGLRHWLEAHHGHLGAVRVKVPVSLHHEGDAAANRDSYFAVALPLEERDPVARLRAVRAATAERKAEHDAEAVETVLARESRLPGGLRRFCARLEASPRRFAVNVSNVRGPSGPVTVLGAPAERLYSLAEIGERHALRVAVVSLGSQLCFGFCADPAIVDDVQAMADGVEAECAALVAAARVA